MELNSDGLERVSPTETNEVKCISTFLSTWLIMQASIQEMGCSALFFPTILQGNFAVARPQSRQK